MDFASWGLKLIDPVIADDRGYWETLSWENIDKYQPDLILVDNRSKTTIETAKAQATWTTLRAAAAGQVTDWPAFWLRNYAAYAGKPHARWSELLEVIPDMREESILQVDTVKLGIFQGFETIKYIEDIEALYQAFCTLAP
jgi:hypothetical protein